MHILVITTTVYVNSALTVIVDPAERLKQYIESILFYLRCPEIHSIVICDNSNFDFSNCKELFSVNDNKKIEILFFEGDKEKIFALGKGYGEGEILSYVLSNSKVLESETSVFCKITGRLILININDLLLTVKANTSYFQRIGINPFSKIKKVDTRFYVCDKITFKQNLLLSYREVDDFNNNYLEHVYYSALKRSKIKYVNFNILPRFKGLSGSTGGNYEISPFRWMVVDLLYYILTLMKVY